MLHNAPGKSPVYELFPRVILSGLTPVLLSGLFIMLPCRCYFFTLIHFILILQISHYLFVPANYLFAFFTIVMLRCPFSSFGICDPDFCCLILQRLIARLFLHSIHFRTFIHFSFSHSSCSQQPFHFRFPFQSICPDNTHVTDNKKRRSPG